MPLGEVEDIRFQTAGSAKARAILLGSGREPVAVNGWARLGREVAVGPQRGAVEVFQHES